MNERINGLRVALSSIKIIARNKPRSDHGELIKTLDAIWKEADRALERDKIHAATQKR